MKKLIHVLFLLSITANCFSQPLEKPAQDLFEDIVGENYDEKIISSTNIIQAGKGSDAVLARTYALRGAALSELQKNSMALEDFNQAILLKSNYAEAYGGRGLVYARLGDNNKARTDYLTAIELKPSYGIAYSRLASLYYNLGEIEKTWDMAEKALKIDPNSAAVNLNVASLFFRDKNYNTAISLYTNVIRFQPKDYKSHFFRGMSYHHLEKYSEALKDYNQAIELMPNSSLKEYPYYYRGLVNYSVELKMVALMDFLKVTRINEENADAWFMYGVISADLDRKEEALKGFKNAAELDPDNQKYTSALKKIKSSNSNTSFDDVIAAGIGLAIIAAALGDGSEKQENSNTSNSRCSYCASQGYTTCWSCNGTGGKWVLSNYSTCSVCSGKKTIDCSYCDN